MPALAAKVEVVAARLGDHAIVMGAAKRAWDRFAPTPSFPRKRESSSR